MQLDSAIANLNALLAEEASLEAQKAAFEQEKEMLSPIRELENKSNHTFLTLKNIRTYT